ncbi:unnamed protein product [Spirodela intermedia]|uniref:Uncharacterized protein n=2 Tax=Spirodela intermedia TaxID=51605 RepID=A0A7I8KGT1_SPIIN|nr:unnamed protein product [Spirodela intermedia]CAA6660155.1 unnamed protein product [Spirodela intermedia]CAA7396476.1 unnamed protein product [Spirodela intermedia]
MAEGSGGLVPPRYDLDAKWDACVDLSLHRFAYSALAGAFGGLLLFRTPASRWASVAFGAGVGLGSAYIECSYIFKGSSPKQSPIETPAVRAASFQEEEGGLPTSCR